MKVVEVADIGEALRAIPGRRRAAAKPRAEAPSAPPAPRAARVVAHPEELMEGWEPLDSDELR